MGTAETLLVAVESCKLAIRIKQITKTTINVNHAVRPFIDIHVYLCINYEYDFQEIMRKFI